MPNVVPANAKRCCSKNAATRVQTAKTANLCSVTWWLEMSHFKDRQILSLSISVKSHIQTSGWRQCWQVEEVLPGATANQSLRKHHDAWFLAWNFTLLKSKNIHLPNRRVSTLAKQEKQLSEILILRDNNVLPYKEKILRDIQRPILRKSIK